MEPFDIDYPLQTSIREALIGMVKLAEAKDISVVRCNIRPTVDEYGVNDLCIQDSTSGSVWVKGLHGEPLKSLMTLGLVADLGNQQWFLYPAAFARAKYERMNRFQKWVARTMHKGRDVVAGIALGLSVFATILIILQVLGVL